MTCPLFSALAPDPIPTSSQKCFKNSQEIASPARLPQPQGHTPAWLACSSAAPAPPALPCHSAGRPAPGGKQTCGCGAAPAPAGSAPPAPAAAPLAGCPPAGAREAGGRFNALAAPRQGKLIRLGRLACPRRDAGEVQQGHSCLQHCKPGGLAWKWPLMYIWLASACSRCARRYSVSSSTARVA